ncbi:hypothetical protein GEMRC1_012636 [Eukaryota sp. GEM-RC1]
MIVPYVNSIINDLHASGQRLSSLISSKCRSLFSTSTCSDDRSILQSIVKQKIKIFIYSGEYDLMCNSFGLRQVLNSLTGLDQWDNVSAVPIIYDGIHQGWINMSDFLAFLIVSNSGHFAAKDNPTLVLQQFKQFLDFHDGSFLVIAVFVWSRGFCYF